MSIKWTVPSAGDKVYKCIASKSINPDKTYLGTAERGFKKRHKWYSREV